MENRKPLTEWVGIITAVFILKGKPYSVDIFIYELAEDLYYEFPN